jgi:3-hydroxyacyl-CoA dehydrogenase/alpha-ketoglutarate-dependent taurine dioxygenase
VSAISGLGTVGLLGGGVIGGGWAARFLLNGVDVKVFDPDPEAPRKVDEMLANARRATRALVTGPLPEVGTLTFVPTVADAVGGVDFVQESGPERLELKQELLAAADAAADSSVVFGSSTSGLLPTKLQAGMQHPERLVVGHPFNPVYLLPLVEVCGGEHTAPTAVARAVDVYRAVGMRPLSLDAEIDGFVADRLLEALWREALWLVRDGFATVEQVDDAIRFGAGLRWSAMGTFLVYRIAGGEAGMRHFMAQFGPALQWPWSRLTDVPELTDELLDRLVAQSDEQAAGRSIRELEALRDDCLVAVMRGLRDVGFGAGEVVADYEHRLAVRARGGGVSVEWDGAELPAFWLRDNCPCDECVHPQTRERVLDTFALDPAVEPVAVQASGDRLSVDWNDGHHSEYAAAWLRDQRAPESALPAPRLWDGDLATNLPEFEYDEVASGDDGLLRFAEAMWSLGIAFVRNAPTSEQTLRDLARRVGPIRPTNFGAEFHVEAKPDPNNVAYTAVELRPHTDLPYHENPPGTQFLHCFAADAPGGESTFVDGFWVADRIRRDDPDVFGLLCEVAIPYRFRDAHHDLRFAAPVISCDLDGRYREVRFHDALMAPFDLAGDRTESTYRALRTFDQLARSDEAQLVVRLQPGDVAVFRNRRVLHGRRAFVPGDGVRRLFGLYVDDDAWQSTIRVLRTAESPTPR